MNSPAVSLSSINISATGSSTIIAGLTNQLTANGSYSDGSTIDISNTVTLSSNAPGIAAVNSYRLVTVVSAGSAIITAVSSSVSGTITVTVNAATLTSIGGAPVTPSIVAGLIQQMAANGSNNTDATYSTPATTEVTSLSPNPDTSTATANSYKQITTAAGPTTLYYKVVDGGTTGSLYNIGVLMN